MLTKKEYAFIGITLLMLLCIFSLLFYDVIDFFYIVLLTFATEGVIKSIYDIKYKTGHQDIYIYSEKTNFLLRLFTFFISTLLFLSIIYVINNKV